PGELTPTPASSPHAQRPGAARVASGREARRSPLLLTTRSSTSGIASSQWRPVDPSVPGIPSTDPTQGAPDDRYRLRLPCLRGDPPRHRRHQGPALAGAVLRGPGPRAPARPGRAP